MAFSHRIATLTAVVAIPLGIAATSYALTDSPDPPASPPKVELESGSPSPSKPASPSAHPSASPSDPSPATPGDESVPQPSATDEGSDDDDDGKGAGGGDDDGPGGDDN